MSTKNKSKKSSKINENENTPEESNNDISVENENSNTITLPDFAKQLADALKTPEVRQGFVDMFKNIIQSEVNNAIQPVSNKLETLNEKLEFLETDQGIKNPDITDRLNSLEKENKALTIKSLKIERNIKAMNLKIVGVKINFTSENPLEKQSQFLEKLQDTLKDARITDFRKEDVSSVSFGTIAVGEPTIFALVSFRSMDARNSLYTQRTKLRTLANNKIYINEDLTRSDSAIFKRAREEVKLKKLFAAWTRLGKVYGKISENGKPFHIDS